MNTFKTLTLLIGLIALQDLLSTGWTDMGCVHACMASGRGYGVCVEMCQNP